MNFPNPTDAIANPVRYWTDVTLMQIQIGRTVYDIAASMNPYLPKDGFSIGAGKTIVRKARRSAARSAPRRAARAPVSKVTTIGQAKAAPKGVARVAPKPDAAAPKETRRPVRKPVSLPPDLPPSKSTGKS